ncbi:hypothetical protein GUJ93_ZPchr0013g36336 [Zizania palustris]|uniref:Mon2/Sec7/BIG1-like dimerisation and cyclophilin-binding domain-containing protein n=1 Tax=Zizania palustris TaxID=103762 RepID=A0A8J5WXJ7_ZIZPA|nr:hypothetical protein GUJ93_ZPchr0013g36336 [Zizania palustris]
MASAAGAAPPTPPESDPRLVEAFVPFLEKLIKNASWRNKAHSKLSHTAKSILDRLQNPPPPPPPPATTQTPSTPTSPTTPTSSSSQPGPLRTLSLADSELLLGPVSSALGSGSAKLAEAALELLHRLIAHSYIHGEADPSADPSAQLVASLLDAACNALHLDDEHIELLLLKTLLSAVTSTSVCLHGDCLLRAVRACYDMYLGSRSVVNQATAKASLVQMLVIVFRRMEADSSTVPVQPIVVADVIELPDAASGTSPAADANFVQGFISKIIGDLMVRSHRWPGRLHQQLQVEVGQWLMMVHLRQQRQQRKGQIQQICLIRQTRTCLMPSTGRSACTKRLLRVVRMSLVWRGQWWAHWMMMLM